MSKKYKIGYTTGVFDLFHIGHLNLLRNAKAICDYLIVGVSTDEVVEEYKHKKPIIPFNERFAIIQELRCVDKVVPQTSMDKMEAWNKYKFEALFHGSDWKGSEMYKKVEDDFEKIGVDVVFLPYTDGTSSTILAQVLHKVMEKNKW